jgi:uncharacterized repeat protein (TIGR01451 family)
MKIARGALVALASLAVALALVGSFGMPAAAQVTPPRGVLIVTVSDSPDPAASAGPVIYAITVKNDGTTKALNVVVTVQMPAGATIFKCTKLLIFDGSPSISCAELLANGIVTVNLGKIKAHLKPRINLTLTMPSVSAVSTVSVKAKANGDDVDDSHDVTETTTVLPPGSFITYLPSERVGPIACGDTLTPAAFGTDTTAKLSGPLGCTSGAWGLRITASGKTLDLNKFNIFWNAGLTAGSVGILVSNATGVTIIGGGTNGPSASSGGSGIQSFDWCVKDEGQSKKLSINTLLCYKARTAGIDIASKKVTITGVKVDRVTGTATTTAVPPGGVGIRTRADKASIKNSRVLKAGTVGIWVSGSDADGNGVVAQIADSSIEDSPAIGLLLDEGPHSVQFTDVKGDGVTDVTKPKDGVVVGPTGIGNRLNGVIVKEHGGNGFVINGTGTSLITCEVEAVGLDGYVVAGSGSDLSGNTVTEARHGFIVSGPATCEPGVVCNLLNTNHAENLDGDAYAVTGEGASLKNNEAQGNGGVAYRIAANAGSYETNTAETNHNDGFLITGSNNTFTSNTAEHNDGVGFNVPGPGIGNHFNTNAASINKGVGEWVIGPGQTDDGNKTNKANGKVFSIPPQGGTFN